MKFPKPSNPMIAAMCAAAFLPALIVGTAAAQRQKRARAGPAAVATAAKPQLSPFMVYMRLTNVSAEQRAPDLVVVDVNMEFYHGRKNLGPVPGNAGVRLDVGVYAPDDPEGRGPRIATFSGQPRDIGPMDSPIQDQATVTLPVPASLRPYNVIVQLLGGNVVRRLSPDAPPTVGPCSFSGRRLPATLAF